MTALVALVVVGLAVPSLAQDPAPAPVPPPAEAPPAPAPAPEAPAAEPAAAPAAPAAKKAAKKKKAKKRKTRKKATAAKTTKRSTARSSRAAAVPKSGTTLDIDISSQRMRIYRGGKLYRTVPVSTGSGQRYCTKQKGCAVARTPRGSFRVYNRINGWRTSYLGKLYNPLYFRGGYAIHGGRLPGYPASHGCVRVSMSTASWLPSVVPNGTLVRIHD
jgi:lipoprotein-anchoring transpeptidase ErfK/SrfK